jgi:hypothetical protein
MLTDLSRSDGVARSARPAGCSVSVIVEDFQRIAPRIDHDDTLAAIDGGRRGVCADCSRRPRQCQREQAGAGSGGPASPPGLQGRLVHPLGWRYRAPETTMAKAVMANAGLCLAPLT